MWSVDPSLVDRDLRRAALALRGVAPEQVAAIAARLLRARDRDGQILIAGNGGSAALASHFACDLAKTTASSLPDGGRRFRALSLSDNVPLLTAWANDVAYERVFAEAVRTLGRAGDLLLVISASGRSPNVLAALRAARELGIETVGWLGFDGGPAAALADERLLVPSADYGLVESVHALVAHLVTACVTRALAGAAPRALARAA